MILLRKKHKSKLYLRVGLITVTLVFGGLIFYGSNSNGCKPTAYEYGGLEEIEFHQALPGRLLFYQISSFNAPAELTISPTADLLGLKSFKLITSSAIVRSYHVFQWTITINAP
jgi:hypothetical protein